MANTKKITADRELTELLKTNDASIRKLHDIVASTLKEEKLMVQNLMHPPAETLTKGQRISDVVASFGGSWAFIIIFGTGLSVWVLYNTLAPKPEDFDPYPFILMNLLLSFVAAMQAPIIMMSQNRKEEKDRKRAENDYMVNLKAELEVRNLHSKIDLLMEEQMTRLVEVQEVQLRLLEELAGRAKRP